jgi:hypothetical protein
MFAVMGVLKLNALVKVPLSVYHPLKRFKVTPPAVVVDVGALMVVPLGTLVMGLTDVPPLLSKLTV